jgi:hypothetical protein
MIVPLRGRAGTLRELRFVFPAPSQGQGNLLLPCETHACLSRRVIEPTRKTGCRVWPIIFNSFIREAMEYVDVALSPIHGVHARLDPHLMDITEMSGGILSYDKTKYVFCALLVFPLALLFRLLPNVSSLKVRRIFTCCWLSKC